MLVEKNIGQDIVAIATQLGDWITGEFNGAEKLYNTLTTDEKNAATWSYGVLAIINKNIAVDGTLIIPIIQKAFPSLSTDDLQGFIDTLLNNIKAKQAEAPLSLAEGLNLLASYLKQFDGSFWGILTQGIGTELTILFSPTSEPQKIASTAELIYQIVIKPLVAAL